jgi:hypothetical protein
VCLKTDRVLTGERSRFTHVCKCHSTIASACGGKCECGLVVSVRQGNLAGWHHPTESEVNIKEKRHRNCSAAVEERYRKPWVAHIHVGTVRQLLHDHHVPTVMRIAHCITCAYYRSD